MKTLHIITWLAHGGAERQLTNLVSMLPEESAIFSIKSPGEIAAEVRASNIPLYSGHARSSISPKWIPRLWRAIREERPDAIMGWMYHGNLAATLTRRLGFAGLILLNVRHSVSDLAYEKPTTRWAIRAGMWCSRVSDGIVYNSETAAGQHEELGYPADKRIIIPNGIDLDKFQPDPASRIAIRESLGVPRDRPLLGLLGRVHPMKNHLGWLTAFRDIRDEYGPVHCVIAGTDVPEQNGQVAAAVRDAGLEHAVTLLPPTSTPEQFYPALDLLIMPSLWGEGFPNVVGEAMACGVPALVTDVGDSAAVVGDTGFVAADGSPAELVRSTLGALQLGPEGLAACGQHARQRMVKCYGLELIGNRYRELLNGVTNLNFCEKVY